MADWIKFKTGVFQTDEITCACSPAAAVPASAKIPEPMIAPMPRQVRSNAVSERFIFRSGASDSRIKSSGLLVRNNLVATTSLRLLRYDFRGRRIVASRDCRGQTLCFNEPRERRLTSRNRQFAQISRPREMLLELAWI